VWRAAYRIAAGQLKARRRNSSTHDTAATDATDATEEEADLMTGLAKLPQRQRAALVLHYLADLPNPEIARALGITTSTVRVHLMQDAGASATSWGTPMPDLRQRFTDLDRRLAQQNMPDLLTEAARREPAPAPNLGPSPCRRAGIVLVALAVTAASTTFLVRAFGGSAAPPKPAVPPAPALTNGVIAYASIEAEHGFRTINPDGTGKTEVHIDVPGGVGVPSWSPDGARIAFDVTSYDQPAPEGGNSDIYTANADGTDPVRLTSDKVDYKPVWSPDGSKIAYEHIAYTHETDDPQIWVMKTDGSDPQRLTFEKDASHPFPAWSPSWSPDGTKIAFVSIEHTNADIYVMNADGVRHHPPHGRPCARGPARLVPRRPQIAFTREGAGDAGIYTMETDGTGVREVLHDPSPANLGMAWSPDGAEMAVVSTRGPGDDRNVYVLDIASDNLTTIGEPGAWWGASWQVLPPAS
jgi:Tol biopolymer transport system component